jgi:uncharacterized protein (UPF0303 family)
MVVARADLVANRTFSPIPATAQRWGSVVQDFRQVQGTVDKRVSHRGGIRQIHSDLRVLDPAGGSGVLVLHADGVGAFLQVSGLIDDQDRALAAEATIDIVT